MLKYTIITVLIILALSIIYYFFQGSKNYNKIISAIKQSDVELNSLYSWDSTNGLRKSTNGNIKILSINPNLIVQIDTGGGHLGSKGVIFCMNDCNINFLQSLLPEGISVSYIRENFWSYKSIEE